MTNPRKPKYNIEGRYFFENMNFSSLFIVWLNWITNIKKFHTNLLKRTWNSWTEGRRYACGLVFELLSFSKTLALQKWQVILRTGWIVVSPCKTYVLTNKKASHFCEALSEPWRIRTFDRLLRREVLYPAELRARSFYVATKTVSVWQD